METKDKLEKLLKIAAQAPSNLNVEPPLGLQTRLIAQWQTQRLKEPFFNELVLLYRALTYACLTAVASFLFILIIQQIDTVNQTNNEVVMVDSEIQLALSL